MKQGLLKILLTSTTLLVFSTLTSAITNNHKGQNSNSDRDVQNNEIITGGIDKEKDRATSESKNTRSFSSAPFHRTSFIARHGGLGIGLGTSIHVTPSHRGGAGYGPPDGPNFSSSGYGHTGAGVHVSGNGYSYGNPGEYPPSQRPPPFDHRGAGPLPDAYDGATYGSAYPHSPGHNDGGLIYAGQTGGHFGSSNPPGSQSHGGPHGGPPEHGVSFGSHGGPIRPYGGPVGPHGDPIGSHGGPIGPYGGPSGPHGGSIGPHGGPIGPPGHHISPHHKLALKSVLIPLAGVAILGAAAALSSAHPILLQLGVAGKRRRRGLTPHQPNSFAKYN